MSTRRKWHWSFPTATESERTFAYGAAIFILSVGVGVLFLSAGVTLLNSVRVAFAGFVLIGIGGISSGCIVLRKWNAIEWRYRAGGAMFLACGIAILILTWRAASLMATP